MKKILFLVSIVSLLAVTSCKKSTDAAQSAADTATTAVNDAAESAANTATSAANTVAEAASSLGVEVPSFENPQLNDWANNFVEAAANVKSASFVSPDSLTAATDQLNKVAAQVDQFKGQPDFEKAVEFVKSVNTKLQAQ